MTITRRQVLKLFGGAITVAPGSQYICRLGATPMKGGGGSTTSTTTAAPTTTTTTTTGTTTTTIPATTTTTTGGSTTTTSTVGGQPRSGDGEVYDQVLTGDQPGGFTVPAGERWRVQGVVRAWANVVVNGDLVMRSGDELQFVGAQAGQYVGGGMGPVASDVGLWVVGGALDIVGTPRTGWALAGSAAADWSTSDTVVVCPSTFGDFTGFTERSLGSAPWPTGGIQRANGTFLGTEVLNVTRDVRIVGPGHIWINSNRPQTVRYAALVNLGVTSVLGRYPLHFHMCGDGSRGSLVEGVLVRGGQNHAFVPHMSHGVTFRDCVAYRTSDFAYWWDPSDDTHMNDSSDTTFDRCLAAATDDRTTNNTRLSAFRLAGGIGNSMTGCVAVGTLGGGNASGFSWPENGVGDNADLRTGFWNFVGNVAHNNRSHGIFTWQNNAQIHDISDFVAYRNGESGILHGAYRNRFTYQNSELLEHGDSGIALFAVSRADAPLTVRDVVIDGRGRTPFGIVCCDHALAALRPTEISGVTFAGNTTADVHLAVAANKTPDQLKITGTRGWSTTGQRFKFDNSLPTGTLVSVVDTTLGQFDLRERTYSGGTLVSAWNAKRLTAGTGGTTGGTRATKPAR